MRVSVTLSQMGNKGRLVVPLELRRRYGWDQGTTLVFSEVSPGEVRIQAADDALAAFRASVAGTPSPVDELLEDRRLEAQADR